MNRKAGNEAFNEQYNTRGGNKCCVLKPSVFCIYSNRLFIPAFPV